MNFNKLLIFSFFLFSWCQFNAGQKFGAEEGRFLEYAKLGNITKVKDAISNGIDINTQDKLGNTALDKAIKTNNLPMVELLIKSGSDVNKQDNNQESPLMKACYFSPKIVELLINNGANLNLRDAKGNTALIVASGIHSESPEMIKLEIVKLFIENGANVNDRNLKGFTALMMAIMSHNYNIIKLLINSGADINIKDNEDRTAISLAQAYSQESVARLLMRKEIFNLINKNDYSQQDQEKIFDLLKTVGPLLNSKDSNGYNLLHLAIIKGDFDLAERLVSKNPKFINSANNLGQTPLTLGFALSPNSPRFLEFVEYLKNKNLVTDGDIEKILSEIDNLRKLDLEELERMQAEDQAKYYTEEQAKKL